MRAPVRVAATLPILLLIAACSGTAPQESSPEQALWGPLDQLYNDTKAQSDEEFSTQVDAVEEQAAACMAELGFEYVPAPGNHRRVTTDELMADLPSSEAFAKEYGYGAVRTPGLEAAGTEDPNEAILERLSAQELAEYDVALHGDLESWAQRGEVPPLAERGCLGAASATLWASEPDPFDQEILAEISRIERELVPADARVTAIDAQWAECMSDAGHPGLESHLAARDGIWEQYLEHGGGEGEIRADGLTDNEREFLEIEIRQATADWQCRDSLGYDAVVNQVRDELQQQFIDSHEVELDAWTQRGREADAG